MWLTYRVRTIRTQRGKEKSDASITYISYAYGENEKAREGLIKHLSKLLYKIHVPSPYISEVEKVENEALLKRLKLMTEQLMHRNILVFISAEINNELRKNRTTVFILERGYTPSLNIKFNYNLSKSEKTQYYGIAISSGIGNEYHYEYGHAYILPQKGSNKVNPIDVYALEAVVKALNIGYYVLQLSYSPSSALHYLTNGSVSIRYDTSPYFTFKRIEKLLMP